MDLEVYKNLELSDLPNEEWIDCIGYDGIYEVSNLGRIKSLSRWRETRPGVGYFMKEKIRKLSVSNDASIRAYLCKDGVIIPYQVSRLVFFSFNYNVENLPEYFVMHKNNNWKDNRLSNLKIGTLKQISALTFASGKMEHLKKGNPIISKHKIENSISENGIIKELECLNCKRIKPIDFFRKQRNVCKKCDTEKWYYNKQNKKRLQGFEIKETEIETGKITLYQNFNDKNLLEKISITTAIKYAKSGEIIRCKPQSNKKFKPFKLEIIH